MAAIAFLNLLQQSLCTTHDVREVAKDFFLNLTLAH